MEQLISWAASHGATFEAVPDAQQRHPRKLFASRDLSPGDVIFSIPEPLLLYGARAYSDAEYGAAFRQLQAEVGPVLDQRSLLVLLLVLEKSRGSGSFFAPYCDMLPDSYDDPFWWSEQDLQLLQGTRLHKAVAHYTTGLQQLHSWLLRLEQLQHQQGGDGGGSSGSSSTTLSAACNGWGLTAAAVKWARSAVWSRAFTIKGLDIGSNRNSSGSRHDGNPVGDISTAQLAAPGAAAAAAGDGSTGGGGEEFAPVIALVPVLDMCDHHPEQRVSWRTVRLDGQQQQQQDQQQQQVDKQQQQQSGAPGEQHQQQPAAGRQAFQFTSLSPVKKGAELYNNYGTTKPNEELLLGFGFVLDQNPNDTFLVSISHPPGFNNRNNSSSTSIDNEDDNEDVEAVCDQAAVWQRRLAAVAAAGLRLDVPISAAEPLPHKLLDVMLLAAALPAWALDSLGSSSYNSNGNSSSGGGGNHQQPAGVSQPPPAVAAAAADVGGSALQGVAAVQGQEQQQHQGLFAAVALQHQLAALVLLQQQLTAKLQGMLPAGQLQQCLQQQLPPSCDAPTAQGSGTAAGSLNPGHARMAAVYVLSQQRLLQAALQAVAQMTHECLNEAAASNSSSGQAIAGLTDTPQTDPAAAPSGDDAACSDGLEGVQLHPQLQLCRRCGVLSVTQAGSADIAAGSVLLRAPLTSCLAGHTEQQLVVQLMLSAANGDAAVDMQEPEHKQEQEEGCCQAAQQSVGGYFSQHWQLQQGGHGSGCGCQVLPWWLLPHNQELVGVLQDTPAGQQLLQASEEFQDDFQALIHALQAATTPAVGAGSGSSADDKHADSDTEQQQWQQQVLQCIQQQPQEAFRMFCWAQQLVQQGAVEVQHEGRQALVLVPGLEGVPKVLRQLLLNVELRHHNSSSDSDGHTTLQQPTAAGPPHVTVTSKAALPAGLRLCQALMAAGSNTQQLLLECGPAAVHAAAAAATAATDADGQRPSTPPAADTVSSSSNSSGAGAKGLQHVYEMMLLPPADAPLRQQKLQLLAAAGLGLCHYVRADAQHSSGNGGSSTGANSLPAAGAAGNEVSAAAVDVAAAAAAAAAAAGQVGNGKHDGQQQQQECDAVLTAMAVCLLSADDAAQAQLLSSEAVEAMVQELQAMQHAAGLSSSAAAAGVQAQPSTAAGPDDGNPAAAGGGGCSGQLQGPVWAALQQQILQRTGKEACKQLLQVLKDDRKAIKAAHKQLSQQQCDEQQVAAEDGHAGACRCRSSGGGGGGEAHHTGNTAAGGVAVYLQGQQRVLDAWVELLSSAGGGGSGNKAERSKKKHKGGGSDSSQKKKNKAKRSS